MAAAPARPLSPRAAVDPPRHGAPRATVDTPAPRPIAWLASMRTLALLVVALALGCHRPTPAPAPTSPPQASPPGSSAAGAVPRPEGTVAPADPSLPRTCTLELELVVPGTATGRGASDRDAASAKQDAWDRACAELRASDGLDCHDEDLVGIVSQRSSTKRSTLGPSVIEHFEFEVVLGARRKASGFGDAPGDREEACRRAKAHACAQLLGGPCPESGVRVLSVDGKPPRPAAVERPPSPTRPRDTI